jgi:hypothetical protein
MKTLEDHKVNPANDTLTIVAVDFPGSGGAHHHYIIQCATDQTVDTQIHFQNGPINEVGVNGLTHEALLAIVADRLRDFQNGPFASRYNALALTHIEEAQNWLNRRTIERMRRGVEGTHKV